MFSSPSASTADQNQHAKAAADTGDGNAPIGIILANTGSPSEPTPEAVYEYLSEFLMDDRIIQMPRVVWKQLLFHHILPKRQHTSADKYRTIWTPEGSPIVVNERSLASKLELALVDAGTNARVRIAMSYGDPSFAESCRQLHQSGCRRLLVLPNYPQSAYCITGSVHDQFKHAARSGAWRGQARFIENYSGGEVYHRAIAESIRKAGFGEHPDDRLLCDFHSIPLKDQKNGDTYVEQVEADVAAIAALLDADPAQVTIGYSSVFGHNKESWVGPLSRNILGQWGAEMAESEGRILFVTPGFAVDCLETLWDIPYELQPAFVEGGGREEQFVSVAPLNDSDRHVAVLLHVLQPYL